MIGVLRIESQILDIHQILHYRSQIAQTTIDLSKQMFCVLAATSKYLFGKKLLF